MAAQSLGLFWALFSCFHKKPYVLRLQNRCGGSWWYWKLKTIILFWIKALKTAKWRENSFWRYVGFFKIDLKLEKTIQFCRLYYIKSIKMILKFLKAIHKTKKFFKVKTSRRCTTWKQRVGWIQIYWKHVYILHNAFTKFGKDWERGYRDIEVRKLQNLKILPSGSERYLKGISAEERRGTRSLLQVCWRSAYGKASLWTSQRWLYGYFFARCSRKLK
jgi:hypothetical protein